MGLSCMGKARVEIKYLILYTLYNMYSLPLCGRLFL